MDKKNSNNLEKRFLEKAFRDLDRNIVCPNQDCEELGNHFKCYDLSYENCEVYRRWKEQYTKEDKLRF